MTDALTKAIKSAPREALVAAVTELYEWAVVLAAIDKAEATLDAKFLSILKGEEDGK